VDTVKWVAASIALLAVAVVVSGIVIAHGHHHAQPACKPSFTSFNC
jgi:hypothetical protein